MEYSSAKNYLEGFINYERLARAPTKKFFGLKRITKLLELLGGPQDKFKSVHIAGTNGKGSTAAMTASILESAGFKTGIYSSPHLISFRERISVNGRHISRKSVSLLVPEIRKAVEKLERESMRPSFFEVYTALCFMFFASSEVDYAVVETGLGGRLDATNAILPEAAAITSISLDHARELGRSIRAIAGEKCGIIKPGVPLVTCPQKQTAISVIRQKAYELNASLTEIRINGDRPGCAIPPSSSASAHIKSSSPRGSIFDLTTPRKNYPDLFVPLMGAHQVENASMAAVLSELAGAGEKHIREGLERTIIKGRLQFFPGKTPVIIDGGHNPQAAAAFAETVKSHFNGYRRIVIFGTTRGKDFKKIAERVFSVADSIILTRADNPRAADPCVLKEKLFPKRPEIPATRRLADAIKIAREKSSPGTLICITGSFFLAGEAVGLMPGPARKSRAVVS